MYIREKTTVDTRLLLDLLVIIADELPVHLFSDEVERLKLAILGEIKEEEASNDSV